MPPVTAPHAAPPEAGRPEAAARRAAPGGAQAAPEDAFEATAEAALQRLRARVPGGAVVPGRPLVPGVWVAADTRQGQVAVQDTTASGALLGLKIGVERPGRWLSLNLALARAPLRPGMVLGLVAALRCAPEARIAVTVRSGRAGAEADDHFPDGLMVRPAPGVGVALLEVTAEMALARPADWRNLMLRLPVRGMALEVLDLRLFLGPAGAAAPDRPTPDAGTAAPPAPTP